VSLGQRILVVDDDPMVASTIERVLRPEGYDVEVALGGLAALSRAREHRPDLVVLDVMMPGVDGLEVCRQLRAEDDLPILLLTARGGTADRVRGASPGSGETLRFADLSMDANAHDVRRGDRRIQLTAREFTLLEHFLRHPRLVLSREQLLQAVWPHEEADDNVVAVYIGYLRQKLEEHGAQRLIQTVRGFGYSLREA
jgi:two-component system response regulator MprA